MRNRIDEIIDELSREESIQLLSKHILVPSYWIKKANMMVWLYLHVLTRHKVVRSFEDLFYSPNGFDFHSVVVIFVLLAIFLSFYDDGRLLYDMIISIKNLVKTSMEEIKALDDEIRRLEQEELCEEKVDR